MSFEWLGNNSILYDGHILNLTPNNEWAVVDAISAYNREKEKKRKLEENRIRKAVREEIRKEIEQKEGNKVDN